LLIVSSLCSNQTSGQDSCSRALFIIKRPSKAAFGLCAKRFFLLWRAAKALWTTCRSTHHATKHCTMLLSRPSCLHTHFLTGSAAHHDASSFPWGRHACHTIKRAPAAASAWHSIKKKVAKNNKIGISQFNIIYSA
jgi:hypothetical protein